MTTMTTTPRLTMHELPMEQLRTRAARAQRVLRDAKRRAGAACGASTIDDALDAVHRLLPGVLDRARGLAVRAVRDLSTSERRVLYDLISGTSKWTTSLAADSPDRPARVLADFSCDELLDALERNAVRESIADDLMALLGLLEHDVPRPPRAVPRAEQHLR